MIETCPDPFSIYTPIHVCLALTGSPDRSVISALAEKASTKHRPAVAFLVYEDPPKVAASAEFAVAWYDRQVSILPWSCTESKRRSRLATMNV